MSLNPKDLKESFRPLKEGRIRISVTHRPSGVSVSDETEGEMNAVSDILERLKFQLELKVPQDAEEE
jgi:hypothetical protein